MQVTVESGAGLERRLKVQLPEEQVQGEVDKRLNRIATTARIPGFRPGKAPTKVIARRFGEQIRGEVVGELVQSSFVDAIEQESLRPAGSPSIGALDAQRGKGVEYTATFDVFPEVELPDTSQLSITRPKAEVTDDDVAKMIETLRNQRRTWETVDRAAQRGDRAVVDFVGKVNGETLEQGTGTEVPIEIGAGSMIPGLEDGLIGIVAGDERTLDLEFPGDYHAADVAGKPAQFEVKAHRVEAARLPDLDDEFASGFGVTEGGADALRKEVRGNMERELADTLRLKTKERVMDSLLAAKPLEVPGSLVEQEVESGAQQREMEIRRAGLDPANMPVDRSELEPMARRRVTLGLLLSELVQKNDIKADPQRVRERVEVVASTYEDPQQLIDWYYGAPERLSQVESSVLEDQIVDWVLERANVTDEAASFDGIMNPGQTI